MNERKNPYVGPRTFGYEDRHWFFGRPREARRLLARVISQQLVLFYAQSGAGKSSLINTCLIPQLKKENGSTVLPVGRVGGGLPAEMREVDNFFSLNLMLSLDQRRGDPRRLSELTLSTFLDGLLEGDRHHVLIVDQFEQIVKTHLSRWRDRAGFFVQLNKAMLDHPDLGVVLVVREDYVAPLEPYAPLLKDRMRARFYMQRLGRDAALEAITEPAKKAGRPFAEKAAKELRDELSQVRVPGADDTRDGEWVDPILLQVVCYQLWENLRDKPQGEITTDDLKEAGNIELALRSYYKDAIREVASRSNASEQMLRNWFEEHLITQDRTRNIVKEGHTHTAGLPNEAVEVLLERFVIRPVVRTDTFYELAHDRLVEPILEDNQEWRENRGLVAHAAETWSTLLRVVTEHHQIVPDGWMPTSRVRPLILGNPGDVWLEFHGARHGLRRDFASPYSFFDFIVAKSRAFNEKWIQENARRASRVCEKTYHVRYAAKVAVTLELMVRGEPVIVEPALWWAPERIYGVPDLLLHTAWLKDHYPEAWQELKDLQGPGKEPEGYVVLETRFGSAKKGLEWEVMETQVRLNSYMLGHMQGRMPMGGFLVTRDRVHSLQLLRVSSELNQPLDADLAKMRDQFVEIKTSGAGYVPWQDKTVASNVAAGDDRWHSARQLIAWEKTPGGDPCALYRIGTGQRSQLAELGYDSIDAMLQDTPSAIPLEDLKGIGSITANQIRAILQANRTGVPVRPKPVAVPLGKQFEFFVDFEFFSNLNVFLKEWPKLSGREMLFMIGVGWEEAGEWQFEVFVAKKEDREQEWDMIQDFVDFLDDKTGGAFTDGERTAIYHWTSAEPSQARRAASRLDLPEDYAFRQLPWVDLQRIYMRTPCGVPGAWSYGLKAVAKALGKLDAAYDPQWAGDLDSGLGAMVMGWKAYGNSRPTTCDEMKILKQYLEADCKALWCILRWMRDGEPGLPFDAPEQAYFGWEQIAKGFSRPKTETRFVDFNDGKGVFVYMQPVLGKWTGIKKVEHLVGGDWVSVLESQGDWRKIYARGALGWVHKRYLREDRLLEVNFVDVGQGDGCFIVTPDDEFILIDAGEEDHMYRFLRWRFRHFRQPVTFKAAIITHPDKDHYYGFRQFFDPKEESVQNVEFECLYHNGIVERKSKNLGPSTVNAEGHKVLTEVIADQQALEDLLGAIKGGGLFLRLLRNAHKSGRVHDIRMLAADKSGPTYMPGFEADKKLSFEVLAPVPEGPPGALHLRWFDNHGKTKNGHSVVLRLKYQDVTMLLGGDLNIPAEKYLLGHYGGTDKPLEDLEDNEKDEMIKEAARFLGSDVAKSCHHGSADFSSEFLRAVDAIVTVVSSGDNEPHSHPRPEALGALGKYGRGDRPLILSTELARSAEEKVKHPFILRQRLNKAVEDNRELEFIDGLIQELGRSVAVYGMITLRTDGKHLLIAQKLEQPGSGGRKWDLHLLGPGQDGRLQYTSPHGH